MSRIHLTEDYTDNMVQFAPNQGVDPALNHYHFDVSVYWFHSKSREALKDKLGKHLHRYKLLFGLIIRANTALSESHPTDKANVSQYIKASRGNAFTHLWPKFTVSQQSGSLRGPDITPQLQWGDSYK